MKLVIQNDGVRLRGSERQALALARGLAARGHDIIVSCRPESELAAELAGAGVRITAIRPRGDVDLVSALRFARLLRHERPDALLLTTWRRVPAGGWAARRARVPRTIVRLGIVRGLPAGGISGWKYGWAFRYYVDGMIVNSDDVRTHWLAAAPWFPAPAVRVVPNGIEVPAQRGTSTLRAELGVPSAVPLLVSVGTLEPRKGVDVLLDALARCARADARLVIAGSGGAEPALRARAAALGVAPRVHWLGYRRDMANVLAGCDIFVLSSRGDSLANAMLEAMGMGLLVIASETGGVRSALAERDGRPAAGWIVPPADVPALAAALDAALAAHDEDGARARQLRDEARARVAEWFSVERMVGEAERVLLHI